MKLQKAHTRMHLIEFANEPLSYHYLGKLKGETKDRLIIATTPEALRSPCPILEHNLDSEIKVITGKEIDFSQFSLRLAENLGIHQKFYARNRDNLLFEEELLMFILSMQPLHTE